MKARDNPEIIIIGGGVAGLSAAIELGRQGIFPVVIEAGSYPSRKVCGEFLSPECLSWLKELNIPFVPIKKAHIYLDAKELVYPFPSPAGSLSHDCLDPLLAAHAQKLGAAIRTNIKVERLQMKQKREDRHRLELSDGHMMSASSIIVATGRIPSLVTAPLKAKYLGIKAHFEGVELSETLHMFGFQGAYLGLSPIEEGKANLACLATTACADQAGSIDSLMNKLVAKNPLLEKLLSPGNRLFDWMVAPVPFFGFKKIPDWHQAYFIGDAALSIPPASGLGLSLAITSGIMAANYAVSNDFVSFKEAYRKQFSIPLHVSKGLHYLLLNPQMGKYAIQACTLIPSLSHQLFKATRLTFRL